jgi:ATP-binding cassette subfamily B protein
VPFPTSETLAQIRKLIAILPPPLRRRFYWLLPQAIMPGLFDIFAVGIVAQLMTSLLTVEEREGLAIWNGLTFDSWQFVTLLALAFVVLSWLRSLARMWFVARQQSYVESMWMYFSSRIYDGILRLPYEAHIGLNESRLATHLLANITKVTKFTISPLLNLASSLFSVVLVSLGVLYIGRAYAVVLLVGLIAAYAVFSLAMTPYLRSAECQKLDLASQMKQSFLDSMGVIREINLYSAEDFFSHRFRVSAERVKRLEFFTSVLPWMPKLLIEPLAITLIFSFTVISVLMGSGWEQLKQFIPFLTTLALASLRLTGALQEAFASITRLRSGLPNIMRLNQLAELTGANRPLDSDHSSLGMQWASTTSPRPDPPVMQHGSVSITPTQSIRLDSVEYTYPASKHPVVFDVSLTIPIGSQVAFVGSTGSGKTTTGLLLLSLLIPQKGQLLLDGVELTPAGRQAWRSSCSYVPQLIAFTRGTVLENIAFGVDTDHVQVDAVWEALEAAQLAEVVAMLPHGIYTPIGRDGIRLSGGQRQRLALARAFYRRSAVMLLDEPTSALDHQTESRVVRAVETISRSCTTIVIAHRLSTIQRCELIYHFEAGRIKASGSFEQLLHSSPTFQALVTTLGDYNNQQRSS